MRPKHAILLFLALVLSAIWAGGRSYYVAEEAVVGDMNRALQLTLQERKDIWLTPDTIRSYRQNLHIEALRNRSTLTYAMGKGGNGLTSRRMRHGRYEVQGLANVSRAEIFSMSDQRLPLSLAFLSLLWAVASTLYLRRRNMQPAPSLAYEASSDTFLDRKHEALRLTPMQHQLMRLLFSNDQHALSKQSLCEKLWPKKPDASETLYTLVRRTKTILEESTGLTIVSDQGQYKVERVKSEG